MYIIPTMIKDYLYDIYKEKDFLYKLEMLECLTKKRIEILRTIVREKPSSIRALSRILERNVKNVFEDLMLLEKNNFIKFEEQGKSKRPVVRIKKVVIKLIEGDDEYE